MLDSSYDTYERLHERSPFAFDAVCMVAAKVRDGGGKLNCPFYSTCLPNNGYVGPPSDVYMKCLEEVQTISCATLFAPVTRQEAVQAMSECLICLKSRHNGLHSFSSGFRMV